MEREPEHCFAVADEADIPKGYVLCAVDFNSWREVFLEEYVNASQSPEVKGMGMGSIAGLEPFAEEYLRICILTCWRRAVRRMP